MGQHVGVDTSTGVLDQHHHVVLLGVRYHADRRRAIGGLLVDGLRCVDEEVHEHLDQRALLRPRVERRHQLTLEPRAVPDLVLRDVHGRGHGARDVDGCLRLAGVDPGERAELRHDRADAAPALQRLSQQVLGGLVLALQQQLDVGEHVREGVVDLVGHAGGQLTQRGELVGVGQPLLAHAQIGGVARHQDACGAALEGHHAGRRDLDVAKATVGPQDAHASQATRQLTGHRGAVLRVHEVQETEAQDLIQRALQDRQEPGVGEVHSVGSQHRDPVGQGCQHCAELMVRARQGLFALGPLSEVAAHRQVPGEGLRREERAHRHLAHEALALASPPGDHADPGASAADRVHRVLIEAGVVQRRHRVTHERGDRLTQGLGPGVAGELYPRVVHVHQPRVAIGELHRVDALLDRRQRGAGEPVTPLSRERECELADPRLRARRRYAGRAAPAHDQRAVTGGRQRGRDVEAPRADTVCVGGVRRQPALEGLRAEAVLGGGARAPRADAGEEAARGALQLDQRRPRRAELLREVVQELPGALLERGHPQPSAFTCPCHRCRRVPGGVHLHKVSATGGAVGARGLTARGS